MGGGPRAATVNHCLEMLPAYIKTLVFNYFFKFRGFVFVFKERLRFYFLSKMSGRNQVHYGLLFLIIGLFVLINFLIVWLPMRLGGNALEALEA